jgi:hypothetical protein
MLWNEIPGRCRNAGRKVGPRPAMDIQCRALEAAGPFSATSRPIAVPCLRNRVRYLDITGEIDVFEASPRATHGSRWRPRRPA